MQLVPAKASVGGLHCGTVVRPRQPVAASLAARSARSWAMKIRLIRHEAVPKTGSYEIRFPDGRPSRFVYWDDIPGRRLRPDLVDSAVAERAAKIFARAEQHKLNHAGLSQQM